MVHDITERKKKELALQEADRRKNVFFGPVGARTQKSSGADQ